MKTKRIGKYIEIEFTKHEVNQTVDAFFKDLHLSKKQRHLLRMSHDVYLNDEPIKQNFSIRLIEHDRLRFPFFIDEEPDFIPQPISFDRVYEDEYFLIVNKPANLLVHPDEKDGTNTLANGVSYYYHETNQRHRVRYLHRLDYETSGLVMFVKNGFLHPYYDHLIAQHLIDRHYLAITDGIPKPNRQTIRKSIGRDRHRQNVYRISQTGKAAITHIETIETRNRYALVKCILETGRTHQIRVHLSSIGTPIVGDKYYHPKPLPQMRHALHAYEVAFPQPFSDERLTISTDLPEDLKQFWDSIR